MKMCDELQEVQMQDVTLRAAGEQTSSRGHVRTVSACCSHAGVLLPRRRIRAEPNGVLRVACRELHHLNLCMWNMT